MIALGEMEKRLKHFTHRGWVKRKGTQRRECVNDRVIFCAILQRLNKKQQKVLAAPGPHCESLDSKRLGWSDPALLDSSIDPNCTHTNDYQHSHHLSREGTELGVFYNGVQGLMVVSLLMLLSDAFKVQMNQQGGVNSVQTGMCIGDFWTSKRNTIRETWRQDDAFR